MCNEFHVVLDIVFWIGLFVLKDDHRERQHGVFGAKKEDDETRMKRGCGFPVREYKSTTMQTLLQAVIVSLGHHRKGS